MVSGWSMDDVSGWSIERFPGWSMEIEFYFPFAFASSIKAETLDETFWSIGMGKWIALKVHLIQIDLVV